MNVCCRALLFDRDGTLIDNVPTVPGVSDVVPRPTAVAALLAARRCGLMVGVVSNQGAIAHGRTTPTEVDAVHARMALLLGRFDVVCYCPHGDADGCGCRKPQPGLVLDAARALGVSPAECVVIGDRCSDVDAAIAAGARGVLVPSGDTPLDELDRVSAVQPTLLAAVQAVTRARGALRSPGRFASFGRANTSRP